MLKKSGFTLAEVLITLGIIGVVAAMTIPTLLSQTNDAEYKTAAKKALSALNQAVTMSVALEGTDFSGFAQTETGNTNSIYYMFTHRMNIVSTGATSTAHPNIGNATNYVLYFNDGMAISFPQSSTSCTEAAPCTMLVDVNGAKKPNMISLATDTTGTVRDQYYYKFFGQQVQPSNAAANYVLFNN